MEIEIENCIETSRQPVMNGKQWIFFSIVISMAVIACVALVIGFAFHRKDCYCSTSANMTNITETSKTEVAPTVATASTSSVSTAALTTTTTATDDVSNPIPAKYPTKY